MVGISFRQEQSNKLLKNLFLDLIVLRTMCFEGFVPPLACLRHCEANDTGKSKIAEMI